MSCPAGATFREGPEKLVIIPRRWLRGCAQSLMTDWRVERGSGGLRLGKGPARRTAGSESLTWAGLLASELKSTHVFVVYFPSRFERPVDATVQTALAAFGRATGSRTSVNTWDPADDEFSRAIAYFDLRTPPALILATGLQLRGASLDGPRGPELYTIAIDDELVLADSDRLAGAINSAHEVLTRADPREITGFVRQRAVDSILKSVRRVAGGALDLLLKCKPKVTIPGGASLQLG